MIVFERAPFEEIEKSYDLVQQHWEEVAKDRRRLSPAWQFFKEAEKLGNVICFVCRKNGEIIAYTVFLLQPDLHATDEKLAYNDAVFLRPDQRGAGLGGQFMQYCETQLRGMGITMVVWHVKPAVDYSRTLIKMGYRHFSTVYAKNL